MALAALSWATLVFATNNGHYDYAVTGVATNFTLKVTSCDA